VSFYALVLFEKHPNQGNDRLRDVLKFVERQRGVLMLRHHLRRGAPEQPSKFWLMTFNVTGQRRLISNALQVTPIAPRPNSMAARLQRRFSNTSALTGEPNR
jgi:hypothetical protein